MARFKITYKKSAHEDAKTEEVTAEKYLDQEEWITFISYNAQSQTEQVLRVRADTVERIERVEG